MGFRMLARVAGCRWNDKALLAEVTLARLLRHEFRRPQFIAPKARGPRPRLIIRTKKRIVSRLGLSSFWTFSRQMALVCVEPSRFRTSGNSDERFHVQRDVRRARTSRRTSRNGIGKSAWHCSNANPARRAGQILPATPGTVVTHSSAGNARVRVSPSAHRTRRKERQHRRRARDFTLQPTRIGGLLLVVTGSTRPDIADGHIRLCGSSAYLYCKKEIVTCSRVYVRHLPGSPI